MSMPEKQPYPDASLYPPVPPAYNEGQPYGAAPLQPYGPAPSQPYEPAPSQPYEKSPSQPYGPAPSQPYEPAPSQPYGPAPSQPYGPSAPNSTGNPVGVVIVQPVGPRTANVNCRSCNKQIMTKVEYTPSTKTHIIALLLCVFGCCPCAVIPYCMDSCQNAEHYCPHCSAFIGTYQG